MADLEERLRSLAGDRSSGAAALALEAVRIARVWREQGRDADALIRRLRSMHPAITAIANVAAAIQAGADLDRLQTSLEQGREKIAERLARHIPPHQVILTLSSSSTVLEALASTLQPRLVLALASEPGGEGAELARALEGAGVPVRLEPDAAMGRLVELEADLALVGADGFDGDGALVHKAGTLPLALCCRRFGKPLIAAAHSIKRVDGVLAQPADVRFDRTPADLVTAIVTEEE